MRRSKRGKGGAFWGAFWGTFSTAGVESRAWIDLDRSIDRWVCAVARAPGLVVNGER